MSEQDQPIEAGNNDASVQDKIAGIIEQTRADDVPDLEAVVRQRLADSGIDITDDELSALL
jgi:hypothetical protein